MQVLFLLCASLAVSSAQWATQGFGGSAIPGGPTISRGYGPNSIANAPGGGYAVGGLAPAGVITNGPGLAGVQTTEVINNGLGGQEIITQRSGPAAAVVTNGPGAVVTNYGGPAAVTNYGAPAAAVVTNGPAAVVSNYGPGGLVANYGPAIASRPVGPGVAYGRGPLVGVGPQPAVAVTQTRYSNIGLGPTRPGVGLARPGAALIGNRYGAPAAAVVTNGPGAVVTNGPAAVVNNYGAPAAVVTNGPGAVVSNYGPGGLVANYGPAIAARPAYGAGAVAYGASRGPILAAGPTATTVTQTRSFGAPGGVAVTNYGAPGNVAVTNYGPAGAIPGPTGLISNGPGLGATQTTEVLDNGLGGEIITQQTSANLQQARTVGGPNGGPAPQQLWG